METLGSRLRRIRIDREKSAQEIAWDIGVDVRTVRSWERDETRTTFEVAIQLADILDVSLDVLALKEAFVPYHDEDRPYYSVLEVSKRACISTTTVYLLVEKGLIEPILVNGKMRFYKEHIETMKIYMNASRAERKEMIYHAQFGK